MTCLKMKYSSNIPLTNPFSNVVCLNVTVCCYFYVEVLFPAVERLMGNLIANISWASNKLK